MMGGMGVENALPGFAGSMGLRIYYKTSANDNNLGRNWREQRAFFMAKMSENSGEIMEKVVWQVMMMMTFIDQLRHKKSC